MSATVALVGATLKWWVPSPIDSGLTASSLVSLPFLGAIALGVVAFVFVLLALRVRSFERLCDPRRFATKTMFMNTQGELVASIVSNYVVTIERNFSVNERKARLLRRAWLAYFLSVSLVAVSPVWLFLLSRGTLE